MRRLLCAAGIVVYLLIGYVYGRNVYQRWHDGDYAFVSGLVWPCFGLLDFCTTHGDAIFGGKP